MASLAPAIGNSDISSKNSMTASPPVSDDVASSVCDSSNGLFRCEDCSFESSSLRKLGRHRSVNHAGTKYQCTECGFVTGYQSNFYRHRKQIHSTSAASRTASMMSVFPKQEVVPPQDPTKTPPAFPLNTSMLLSSLMQPSTAINPMLLAYSQLAAVNAAASANFLQPFMHPFMFLPQKQQQQPDITAPTQPTHRSDSTPSLPSSDEPAVVPTEIFNCSDCKYASSNQARFRKHLRCHQTDGPSRCNECDFSTVYAWNLDRHLKSHNTPSRFTCNRCSFSHSSRQSITFHVQHHHNIACEEAGTQTEEAEYEDSVDVGSEQHQFDVHSVRVDPSYEAASESAASEEAMQRRNLARFPANGSFRRQPTLDELAKLSRGNSPLHHHFAAEEDAIESPNDADLLREAKNGDVDPDIQHRTCSICGYRGKWISEMIRHKRVHTNERPFKCKHCSRTSKWKADLIRHLAKVHGIRVVSRYSRHKPLDSQSAQKSPVLFSSQILPSDEATPREKPYQCSGCGYRSNWSSDVHKHIRLKRNAGGHETARLEKLHPEEMEKFHCGECVDFSSASKDEVIAHLNVEHDLSPYGCSACSFGSAETHSAREHCSTEHESATVLHNLLEDPAPAPPAKKLKLDSEAPLDLSVKQGEEESGHLDMAGISEVFSDFGAIIDAVGEEPDRSSPDTDPSPQEHQQSHIKHTSEFQLNPSSELIGKYSSVIARKVPGVSEKPKNHRCALCPARFTDRTQLQRHSKFHGRPDLKYKCNLCNYAVPFPINLTKHYKSHHARVLEPATLLGCGTEAEMRREEIST